MAKYRIEFNSEAQRALARLPVKIVDAILYFCNGQLAENPRRVGKPLKGEFEGAYSARRGSYRIIYEIHEREILVKVIRVGHRDNIYRPFVLV